MAAIYYSTADAIQAALAASFAQHPWMDAKQVDQERVIVRESMIVCDHGIGTRYTTIYRDISGRYVGYADCYRRD